MKELNFDVMREELNRKEEYYNACKELIGWCDSYFLYMCEVKEESAEKDRENLTLEDYIVPDYGSWQNTRGKYELIKKIKSFIEKEVEKI